MDSLKPELQKSLNDVIQAIRDGLIPLKHIVDSIIPVRVKLTKAQRIEKKKEYYKQWSEKHSDYWRVYNNKKKVEAAAKKKLEDAVALENGENFIRPQDVVPPALVE